MLSTAASENGGTSCKPKHDIILDAGKDKEIDSPSELPEITPPCGNCKYKQVKPLRFLPQNLKRIYLL